MVFVTFYQGSNSFTNQISFKLTTSMQAYEVSHSAFNKYLFY